MSKFFFTFSKVRYRALFFALLFLCSSLLPLLSLQRASAATSYDDDYKTVDHLYIKSWSSCKEVDITLDWYTRSIDPGLGYRTSDGVGASNSASKPIVQAGFQESLNSSTGSWLVSQVSSSYGSGHNSVEIIMSPQELKLNWPGGNSVAYGTTVPNQDVYKMILWGAPGTYAPGVSCAVQIYGSSKTTYANVTDYVEPFTNNDAFNVADPSLSSSSGGRRAFVTAIEQSNWNLPTGYAGILPRTSYDPVKFWMSFRTQIKDKELKVLPNATDNPTGCFVYSTAIYRGSGDDVSNWTPLKTPPYDTNIPRDTEHTYNDLEYADDYHLVVVTDDCPPPALDTEYGQGYHQSQVVDFKIDGSSYTLDTRNMDCADRSGFCTNPEDLEDCSTYGTDVVGGFGCVMSNFFKLIKGLFVTLFVPKPYIAYETINSIGGVVMDKLGALGYSVGYIISFGTGLVSHAATGSCSMSFDGTFFGSTLGFNFCKFESMSPTIWNSMILMLRGLTLFSVMLALYKKHQEFIKQ